MFEWLFRKKGCAKDMNNKLEVIGIDHGWSMMKTISQVFVTGVKEITTTPALFGDVLEYEGKYYKVGTVRQEVKDNLKTTPIIFVGGGAVVMKNFSNYDAKNISYILDIKANARGYEQLATMGLKSVKRLS